MKITIIYTAILYLVVVITSAIFLVKDYYTIAGLLIIGNLWPGYAMANSMMRNDEN
tara:strand:- start:333 stop:500 length:168 start_codon:yes stop_codon:yes gene_type:complete